MVSGSMCNDNHDKHDIMQIAFQALLDSTKDMMFVKDINLVYIAASMPFAKTVGKESVEGVSYGLYS